MSQRYTEADLDAVFSDARAQATEMEARLLSSEAMIAEAAELEEQLDIMGREYQRLLFQAHLNLRAATEERVEVRGADGVRRGYARESRRPLRSRFGLVWVWRLAYQRESVEGLHPLDGALNLPHELYSYSVRRLVAAAAAEHSFDKTQQSVALSTGMTIGKRQLEELAVRAAVDFDAFYAEREAVAEDPRHLLVLSFDAKGIVMRHEDLRPATRQAAEAQTPKLSSRLSKGEKRNRKRMAEVAAVYALPAVPRTPEHVLCKLGYQSGDAEPRPRPKNKRVWARVEADAKQVIWAAFAEALARDPERRRKWVVLVDGHRDQLKLVKWAARKAGVAVTIVLDLMHVLEYIWTAAWCFYEEGSVEAEQWVRRRLVALLEGRSGGQIAHAMRRLADQRELSSKERKPVEDCARYLVNNTRYLRYDRALAQGMPLATGVIEGACRHLVKARMDGGARWSLLGAEAVLRLRALSMSGDFDEYWAFHLRCERERNHLTRYAGNVIPLRKFQANALPSLQKAA